MDSISGWRSDRTMASCTSSRSNICNTSSEWPVRTATSTRGYAAANRCRIAGKTYVLTEGAAGVGQTHPATGAGEERLAHLALQGVEAGRQRGLGDEHRLGGTADVPPAGDFEEPLDLGEQHALAIELFYRTVNGEAAETGGGYSPAFSSAP